MATNLLEMITSALGDHISGEASQFLGESEGTTKSALSMIVPALLGGLAKQGSTSEGAAGLLKSLTGADIDTGILGNLAGLFSGGSRTDSLVMLGSSLVGHLFGDKAASLVSAIASLTGLKSSSSSNLLYMVAPLVFGFLKKWVTDKNVDAPGLMSLLGEQKSFIKDALPGPLAGALGLGSFLGEDEPKAAPTRDIGRAAAVPPPEEERSIWGKILPWLAVLGGLLAALALFRGVQNPAEEPAVAGAPAAPAVSAPAVPATVAPTTQPVAAALPAKVYFEVGSATIGPEGNAAIDGAAVDIKGNGLTVDITGYTDKTGNVAANSELAKQRAVAVKNRLVAAGVPEGRIVMKPPFALDTTGTGSNAEARRVEITRAN